MVFDTDKDRSLWGKIAVNTLTVLASLGVVAMSLSILSAFVNPQKFIWTAFFGLAFWVILFYNILIFLIFLPFRSKRVWVSVAALLIAIPGVLKSYSFGSSKADEGSIRIMSYNVHNFRHIDGTTKRVQFADQVMEMVREQAPDILCCQEFSGYKKGVSRQQCIQDFAESTGLQYVYYNRNNNYGGNVIFSKFPITKVSEKSGFGHEHTYGVMVSVDAGEKGKFHVANVHLLSNTITDSELDVLTSSSERQNNLDTVGKSVFHKLKYAFKRRSDELKTVIEALAPIEGPIIICGDFNEPPLSYNYRQMRKAGFVDTFTKVGRGIKPTYAGKLPLLRIDYIWANDGIKPLDFERYKYKASDHYPVMLDFKIQ